MRKGFLGLIHDLFTPTFDCGCDTDRCEHAIHLGAHAVAMRDLAALLQRQGTHAPVIHPPLTPRPHRPQATPLAADTAPAQFLPHELSGN
jgi:hypothetical protein